MSKTAKFIVVLGVALLIAFALNPSAERHRQQIKTAIADRSPLAGVLGLGALAAFASNYHTLGIASYTSIHGKTISIGIFGIVFVLDTQQDL